jgi:hypothetical protein
LGANGNAGRRQGVMGPAHITFGFGRFLLGYCHGMVLLGIRPERRFYETFECGLLSGVPECQPLLAFILIDFEALKSSKLDI